MQPDLCLAIALLIGVTALITFLLSLLLYFSESDDRWRLTPNQVLGIAAILRTMFVFSAPTLSDDVFRYLWDGLTLLGGHNPYTLAPIAAGARDGMPLGLLGLVNHSHLITIYPPAAQLVFSLGAAMNAGVVGIKLVLVCMDLFTCLLLIKLLKRLQRPPGLVLLYAWHPLPVLEIAASGHIDAAGMLFAVLAVYLCLSDPSSNISPAKGLYPYRLVLSGLVFSMAVLTKLFPLVFLPGLLILAGRPGAMYFGLGAAAGALLLLLPFYPDIRHVWTTLSLYARTWEFSGFVYRLLAATPLAGMWTRWLIGIFYAAFMLVSYGPKRAFHAIPADLMDVFYRLSLVFLLLTPTLHPWYALYLALLLPFAAGPAGLVLSWAVFLAYRVLIGWRVLGLWVENDQTALMIFAAPIAAGFLSRLARRYRPVSTTR